MAQKSLFWFTDGFDGAIGDGAAPYTEEEFRGYNGALLGEGVVVGAGNELAVTGTATPLAVNTGRAQVSGFHYFNTASVNLAVTTPTVGTTGGRVALVANWTAATVRLAIKLNTDGNSAIPAMTQTPGVLYEISLASFTVTTGGVITLTDTRQFIPSPLTARQGGSATDWFVAGTSTQAVNGSLFQAGSITFPVLGGGVPITNINEPVTFPVEFADKPLVVATLSAGVNGYLYAIPTSGTGFNVAMIFDPAVSTNTSVTVSWLAIGPRK